MASTSIRKGGCLCGAVQFEVPVPAPSFNICHCRMCRKWCSGPFMGVHCDGPAIFSDDSAITWFRSSEWAERGFCGQCGTNLFWRLADPATPIYVVSVEALEDRDDIELERHIYIEEKPARYEFKDDKPRITEAELMVELGITPPD